MTRNLNRWASAPALATMTILFCAPGNLAARGAQGSPQGTQSAPAQQQQSADKDKQPAPLSMDSPQAGAAAAAPVAPPSPEEEAAFKAFQAVPPNDIDKRIPMAEQFLQKYPQSRYR